MPSSIPESSQSAVEAAKTILGIAVEGIDDTLTEELSIKEVILVESLLTPGLQTSVKLQSYMHDPNKFLEDFKNKNIIIEVVKPILLDYGFDDVMKIKQRIYRLDSRRRLMNNVEEFTLHACDDSLLNDARSLVSQSWKCVTPTSIATQVMQQCLGIPPERMITEESRPARDYIADNIHPFKVIAEQTEVALANSNDPSFLHYMTYENFGTHNFRSLYQLTRQNPIIKFWSQETGDTSGYAFPHSIIDYSFPCDFDLLSDLLNGVEADGSSIKSIIVTDPAHYQTGLMGNQAIGCGLGGGPVVSGFTNDNNPQDYDSCNMDVQNYLLKRQARMNLLEQDKVALRLTVPWNPILHAGKVIEIELINKELKEEKLFGSGKYLIASLTHTIKQGGFSVTTMDCVAETAGRGVV
jgi:hypothetical protein